MDVRYLRFQTFPICYKKSRMTLLTRIKKKQPCSPLSTSYFENPKIKSSLQICREFLTFRYLVTKNLKFNFNGLNLKFLKVILLHFIRFRAKVEIGFCTPSRFLQLQLTLDRPGTSWQRLL